MQDNATRDNDQYKVPHIIESSNIVTLVTYIQEVGSLNLRMDTDYLDLGVSCFCLILPVECCYTTLKQATTSSFQILLSSQNVIIPYHLKPN